MSQELLNAILSADTNNPRLKVELKQESNTSSLAILGDEPLRKRRKTKRHKKSFKAESMDNKDRFRVKSEENKNQEIKAALRQEIGTLTEERDQWERDYHRLADLMRVAKKYADSVKM